MIDNENDLTEENFLIFFNLFLRYLQSHTPNIIKILLKLIHITTPVIFTIEKDCFIPIFKILFLNFFISPKIQNIHNFTKNNNIVYKINNLIKVNKKN